MQQSRARLGSVTENYDKFRRPVKSSDRTSGPNPYFGASGVVDYVDGYTHDGENLLIAEDGENLRTRNTPIAIMATGKIWVNNHAHVVRANSLADTQFLSYALADLDISGYLTGSTIPKLSRASLDSIEIDIPPISDQKAIVDVLGALDDKIAANQVLSSKCVDLAQLIFQTATVESTRRPMSEVLTPVLGGTPNRSVSDYWVGKYPWASARDVTAAEHGVIISTNENISDAAVGSARFKPLPPGSVIMTARGTVGAVARLGVAASFNQSCYGFSPSVIPASVLYFSVLRATEQAKSYAHGSIFSTITTSTFDHLIIPTFGENQLADLEKKLSPLLDITTSSAHENVTLAALRDTLLPELMSGRMRVRDAEEQVEEVL